jgi:hypothetical protein
MRIVIKITILLVLFFSIQIFAAKNKKAQAVNPQVEIYGAASFDADVIEVITPGTFYTISNKPRGPFYQIKLKNGKTGYVPDTELEIEGEGAFQPKAFNQDLENSSKSKKNIEKYPDEEADDTDSENLSYHSVNVQLVNYHEVTLDGLQVADLYAFGYRKYPQLNDFASSFVWGVSAAFKAPDYYGQQTGQAASGFALWSDFQVVHIAPLGSNTTFHYGAGPFLKYTHFEVGTKLRNYILQDLTAGVVFDVGLIFHFNQVSYDLNLRYYWDKKSYGSIGFGVLF